jgi:cell division protein FtsZ
MDLRTSEFHVVGDTIKQYASEDATVVVGYVIDPEMTDQIRVTVVATGIGRPAAVRGLPQGVQPKVEVVAGGRPVARRQLPTSRPRLSVGVARWATMCADSDDSYLDIPAFLRRRADEAGRRPVAAPKLQGNH